jgi:succinyl-CoA synthetase beta subunit
MKIHEYQGKEVLQQYGVPVPRGYAAFSIEEAVAMAQKLGGAVWVVKAQIHAGGRGKGGGVKVAKSLEDVRRFAAEILGMQLKTHQTGPEGQSVRRLYIEEGANIQKEYYLSVVTDRATQRIALMGSSEGGMDIEAVAKQYPEKIITVYADTQTGLLNDDAHLLAKGMGIPEGSIAQAVDIFQKLYTCYMATDASLLEINPLNCDHQGRLMALDAKFNFDPNALFRQPKIVAYRDFDEEEPAEIEAKKSDLAYIQLDGNIGCLVNGAGLAMATMDSIQLHGGTPANFLDVGGGATAEKVTDAFKIMLKNPNIKGILVNIFGGIMKCDTIATGVIQACKAVDLKVPLVVRMKGTNEMLGKQMLADSGLPIISADSMTDASKKIVAAVNQNLTAPAMLATASSVANFTNTNHTTFKDRMNIEKNIDKNINANVNLNNLDDDDGLFETNSTVTNHAVDMDESSNKPSMLRWLWLTLGALALLAVAGYFLRSWLVSAKTDSAKKIVTTAIPAMIVNSPEKALLVTTPLPITPTTPTVTTAQPQVVAPTVIPVTAAVVNAPAVSTLSPVPNVIQKTPHLPVATLTTATAQCNHTALAADVQFLTASATLTPESITALSAMAKTMATCSTIKVEVAGHTDSSGHVERHQKLSQNRADAVVVALVNAGVAANRLSAKGYGSSKPIADNNTIEGQRKNRRVEFVAQ